jgi:ATP-dependent Clp protease ATP-binding subunit ClpA
MAKPFLFVQKTGIGKVEVAEKEKGTLWGKAGPIL